jgi:hypothetical protein
LLVDLLIEHKATEIVSGTAKGADHFGELVAEKLKLPVKKFVPDWMKHGKSAGMYRNKEMALYANAAILFKGGKGTSNMRSEMLNLGKPILYDAGMT